MSPEDNSRAPNPKSLHQFPLHCQSSRFGRPTPQSSLVSSVYSLRPPRRTMHTFTFVPRPFPPPALADVPLEYIIDQLRRLAPHYWSKPETSDCTILVPLDSSCSRSIMTDTVPGSSVFTLAETLSQSNALDISEVSIPVPRMVMKLHMDYLSAHSALLRGLLSGASPFDLIDSAPTPPIASHSSRHSPTGSSRSNRSSMSVPLVPSLLPSLPTRPTIFLPVPDPPSLRLLVHYIYFGCTSFIEDALDRGVLSWEGLARNVEYLGMGPEIKVFLGQWYGRWRHGHTACAQGDDYNSSDSDSDSDSSAEGDDDMDSTARDESIATSVTLTDHEDIYYAAKEYERPEEPPRGRRTARRCLGHSTSDPEFTRLSRLSDIDARRPPVPRGRSK
ncbi:hypothetical protein SCP_0401020 [Sparassis crispa]|uniref:BTB domain-containing protein n=1 Tax=Sparassis crispa TaxID=139825 RepID=A0A401GHZ4_9APHY|nr:hypothetical protein SCP_0401020 [Sparassis crispa]GBE81731.1 hypothetical protein SCP_0401020 [Sparassis crispa]